MAPPLKKILCIDDEDDILQVATLALEQIGGFEVSSCNSGKAGLEYVCKMPPDLILLDAMMPHMDGPSTLKELRKNPETGIIPVIFMTARVQPEQIQEYIAIGAVGVITKPFDPMTLSKDIALLWEKLHGA